jgi:hypothetical protein
VRRLTIGLALIAGYLALAATVASASAEVITAPAGNFGPLTCNGNSTISFTGGAFRIVTAHAGDRIVIHLTADQVTAKDQDGNPYRLIGAGTDVFAEPGDTLVTGVHHGTLIGADGQRIHPLWFVFHATLTPTGRVKTIGFDQSECS